MTDRMGYWVDMREPYRTMDPEYVESVWWSLKQIYDKGLLVEDYRVAPYCPRCGTGLSDHELAQGLRDRHRPVGLRPVPADLRPVRRHDGRRLLVWTTTPWTLVSNTSVAAHPDVTYVVATNGERDPRRRRAAGRARRSARAGRSSDRFTGAEMERWTYQRPFELVEWPARRRRTPDAHFVVLADYVTTEDGTGLVHQSPAFGEDDLAVVPAHTACRW